MTRKTRPLFAALVLSFCSAAVAVADDPMAPASLGQQPASPDQGPASLGQQPIKPDPAQVPVQTPANAHQLNQLFQFPTTPDALLAGEGYVSGQFDYLSNVSGGGGVGRRDTLINGDQFRFRLQGQYAVTDQVAVGGYLPLIDNAGDHGDGGFGDLNVYGQYRLDQVIDPKVIDLTIQVDAILPTGDYAEFRDSGRIGLRPQILAYKDFGQVGPGVIGAYGQLGYTIADHTDVHMGIAGTYEVAHWAGILEFYGVHAFGRRDRSWGDFTPGVAYRGFQNLDLALGVPIGLTNKSTDVGLTLKLTYTFPN